METSVSNTSHNGQPTFNLPQTQTDGNRFQLLNGTWIEGHPLPVPQTRYEPLKENCVLFCSNAFLFWRNRDIVYSDSRMFLAPVPITNKIAYSGTSGFRYPTLGVYLEWWEHNEASHVFIESDADGSKEERLIWFISGSPLSGSNACSSVNESGKMKTTPVDIFRNVWRSFVAVNTRYDAVKPLYQAYSLEQVAEMLKALLQGAQETSHIEDLLFK